MDGRLHYRVVGGYQLAPDMHIRPGGRIGGWLEAAPTHLRSAGDRTLLGRLVPWRTPARIVSEGQMTYLEWFTRGAIGMSDRPVLSLKHLAHGGHVIGESLALLDEAWGMDGILEVAEGRLGDGVLDLVDRAQRVPLSIGFKSKPGGFRIHDGPTPGVERTAVELLEVAVVAMGAYSDAHVVSRMPRPSNADLARRMTAGRV